MQRTRKENTKQSKPNTCFIFILTNKHIYPFLSRQGSLKPCGKHYLPYKLTCTLYPNRLYIF